MDGAAPPPDPPVAWAEVTSSPVACERPRDPLERAALERCGSPEAGLAAAAREAVARRLRGEPMPGAEALAFAQRSSGEPHPWARAWAAAGRTLPAEATLAMLDAWLAEDRTPDLRRCAVASAETADGTRALAVVAVDALADLTALPVRARTGQWLTVRAKVRVPADGATVTVLGPSGVPRRIPAWFEGAGELRARFVLDRPGAFDVQVLASTVAGPRPVLEASVFADVEPPSRAPADATPRVTPESTATEDPADALAEALASARADAGEPPLLRDPRLDALALAHAMRMRDARDLAHDAGDGEPDERLRAAGIAAAATGENVAHGRSAGDLHESLWSSPSHRANILQRRYDRVGVAAVRDDRGELWGVEFFMRTR
jgi:uncharacterized protein YkwD